MGNTSAWFPYGLVLHDPSTTVIAAADTQDQGPWLQAIRAHKHLHIRTRAIQKMVTFVQHTDSLEGVWSPSKSARLEATGIRFHWRPHLVALRMSRPLVLSTTSMRIFGPCQVVLDKYQRAFGVDQISYRSNVLTDVLDKTKYPARSLRTRRGQHLPEVSEGCKGTGNTRFQLTQVRVISTRPT